MPMYDFECDCGYEFEQIEPTGTESVDCPRCGEGAARAVSGFGGFEFRDSESLGDPGIEDPDHWIGRDAEKRAEIVKDRQHRKRQLRHKRGDDAILTRDETGRYDVVEEDKTDEVKQLHELQERAYRADEYEDVDLEKMD